MGLTTLAELAQVLSGAAVVIAIVFGIAQMRQFQRQRLDAADLELMRMMQDREFVHAFMLIYPIPGTLSLEELRALGEEHEVAALALSARFEAMGLLVFRGSIPIDLVEQIIGGNCILFWHKLQPWIERMRIEQQHPLLLEWFQWLAERLEERNRLEQVPAYRRFKSWQPPK